MSTVVDLGTLDHRLGDLQRPAGTTLTSGLCRAVAARLGVDPLVIRLAVIGLVFAAGLGLVLYAWGTLLTPRVGKVAPIRRFVPAFERWSAKTQVLVVIISSLTVVISSAAQGNVSLFPAVLVVVLILVLRRRGPSSYTDPGQRAWAPPAMPNEPGPAGAARSIEQWRSRLAAYATIRNTPSDPLPVVDLYGPEPEAPVAPPRRSLAKVSWLGALAIAVISLAAAGSTVMFGLTPTWLWALAVGTGTAGVAMVLWSLLVRSRRLPTLILVLALGAGAVASGAVLQLTTPAHEVIDVPASEASVDYEFVAQGNGVVDLTDLPLDATTIINVDATFSNVSVILPAEPAVLTQNAEAGNIEIVSPSGRYATGERPRSAATVHITAVMSNVTVEYVS